jgi:hypothetical protein
MHNQLVTIKLERANASGTATYLMFSRGVGVGQSLFLITHVYVHLHI